jgi:hypothetical protein
MPVTCSRNRAPISSIREARQMNFDIHGQMSHAQDAGVRSNDADAAGHGLRDPSVEDFPVELSAVEYPS